MKKRIFLRFEAASQKAEVKLNGQEVGEHVGGFNAFCFEITPYVHSGENLLEVAVSNRKELNIGPVGGGLHCLWRHLPACLAPAVA